MINLKNFLDHKTHIDSLSLKKKFALNQLKQLTEHHYNRCKEYKKILVSENYSFKKIQKIEDLPFLPTDLFKRYSLKSVPEKKIYKILNSSGTSGQLPSKIYLDKETSNLQSKVLVKIVNSIIDTSRIPMIIIDSPKILKEKTTYSARVAGILGFSIFATEKFYLFDENMNINFKELNIFLNKYKNKKILLFGFTFIIWKHFYKIIVNLNKKINIPNGILIHGGGWKKLNDNEVTNNVFKKELKNLFGLKEIHNYYGMVEQTGSIFMECKKGYFHSSLFNDILIRNMNTLEINPTNKLGVIQAISLIPISYPGHSILTEDVGVIAGLSGCKCGAEGKFFKVNGRLKKAEIRGCSDTYEF
ncbi:hypothetical protein OAV82_00340 [Candidatus Pelagibacter sp.]|nr:hypothetical protein [Candidatus Pelagibacter sp.]